MEYNKTKSKLLELLFLCLSQESLLYSSNKNPSKTNFQFNDIGSILEIENGLNGIKLTNFLRQYINNILSEKVEIISIKNDNNKKEFASYFYLDLIINEKSKNINYTYSIEFLKEVNDERNIFKDKYKIIIIAKINIDLINNFKGTQKYNEDKDKVILDQLEQENMQVIQNNIQDFNSIGLNYDVEIIIKKKIDEIYIDIINALIKKKNFENYECIYNILNQLGFLDINLTNSILEKLKELLNRNEEYMKDFLILKIEDFFNEKKTHFYFLLFKYILKDSINIYQFSFLLELKKTILSYLKKRFQKIIILKENNNIIEKIDFILKTILDSDYYWKNYLKNKFFEFKEKNNDNKNVEIYLQDNELTKSMYLRYPLSIHSYSIKNEAINYQDKNNKEISFKIFNQNDYEYIIKEAKQNLKISKERIEIDKNINESKNIGNEKPTDDKENHENNINLKNEKNYNIKDFINLNKNELINFDLYSNLKESKIDEIISHFLNKCEISFHINCEKENSFIYNNIYYGEQNIRISYEQLMEYKALCLSKKEKNDYIKNFLLYFDFLNEIECRIKKEFINNYNLKISIETNKEKINYSDDPSIYNISCIYKYYDNIRNTFRRFKEENILINKTNSNCQGFEFLLNDINNYSYVKIDYEKKQNSKIIKGFHNKKINNIFENEGKKNFQKKNLYSDDNIIAQFILNNPLSKKISDMYKIIEFEKMIGKNNHIEEPLIGMINDKYLSSDKNVIILYDIQFFEKIRIFVDFIFNDIEKEIYNKKTNNKSFFNNINEEINFILSDRGILRNDIKHYQSTKKANKNHFEKVEKNIIRISPNGSSYYLDLFNDGSDVKQYKISNKAYFRGIKIDDKILALISNSIIPSGEDKLIFYDIQSKKIHKEIDGYSFNISNNNMTLISRQQKKLNNKILLCACWKYKNQHKNGILLVNPNLADNERLENEFYETDQFEVYCFCPIIKVENINNNLKENEEEYIKSIKIMDTDYFFVGGFDAERGEGVIKLFKIIFGIKISNAKIEFIQDIVFEENQNFEEFDMPINSIYQSKKTGKIMISSYNGNTYLFSHPNLDYYLNNGD